MSESRTLGRAGLVSAGRQPVPLRGVAIDAEISSLCARVVIAQRYMNEENTPIEAVYLFPLDEGAAVCGFEAVIDNTLVVGEVRPRDEAFEQYDDAIARGDGAFLLDEERPDIFQASIGNLPPGKEILIRLTYVTEVAVDGGSLRFAIPTTVAPRYAPAEDHTGLGRPDSETLNPPVAWDVPYGLDLSVRLAMPAPISRLESPSHPIAVRMDEATATVTLAHREAALDRDFVLAADVDGLDTPQAWIERDDDGGCAIAIASVPALPSSTVQSEVIFLVDRSGSMDGDSIAEVRNALQLCLRSLISGCRFNIVGFGSTFEALFDSSRPYDDGSLAEAAAHVAGMRADLGGTEILPALKHALEAPRQDGHPKQVIVLTDGEVSNTDAVLALAREHQAAARIFTFGIGASASHHLVKGLARAGGGAAEFIHPGERIEPKVLRQFSRLLSPALTGVRVNWGGLRATQAPSVVPPVFSGSRLLLYALCESALTGSTTVRLEAESPAGPVSFDVPIDPARGADGLTVATLAARALIRELEESPEWASARGSRQANRKTGAISKRIVALATKYCLVSRETSYVAIERRETPALGDVQLRRIPIALAAGWGGVRARHGTVAAALHADPGWTGAYRRNEPVASSSWSTFNLIRKSLSTDVGDSAPLAAPMPSPDRLRMHEVAGLQRADGSWPLSSRFASTIGVSFDALQRALDSQADRETRTLWATALALAWLEEHAAAFEDEWRLIADKARRRLASANATALVARAAEFLQAASSPPVNP